MRCSFQLIVVVVGVSLLTFSSASALEPQGSVLNRKPKQEVKKEESSQKEVQRDAAEKETKETVVKEASESQQSDDGQSTAEADGTPVRTYGKIEVTPEEKQRAAAAQQAAVAEEQQVLGRLRGIQALMEKEENMLAQRLAYAAKIREKGLASNDQKLLDQAEDYERRALDYYQKKVQQFESLNVGTGTSERSVRQQPTRQQPTRTRSGAAPTRSNTRR